MGHRDSQATWLRPDEPLPLLEPVSSCVKRGGWTGSSLRYFSVQKFHYPLLFTHLCPRGREPGALCCSPSGLSAGDSQALGSCLCLHLVLSKAFASRDLCAASGKGGKAEPVCLPAGHQSQTWVRIEGKQVCHQSHRAPRDVRAGRKLGCLSVQGSEQRAGIGIAVGAFLQRRRLHTTATV